MDLSDRTVPYEILIRFGDDGGVQGAHYVTRRIVELDGERLKDEIGPAEPLALAAEGKGRPVLDQVLGDALVQALAAVEALAGEKQALEAELAAALNAPSTPL